MNMTTNDPTNTTTGASKDGTKNMDSNEIIRKTIGDLQENLNAHPQRKPIPFQEFLERVSENPQSIIRSIFQVFHDMIDSFVGGGHDEYPDDPESIGFVFYDCNPLFAEGTDHPFFADRLFANRFVSLAKSLRKGAQQNKIYIFEGPPGCGKSTFLNNLLFKFENYANTKEGARYQTVWRLRRESLNLLQESGVLPPSKDLFTPDFESMEDGEQRHMSKLSFVNETEEYIEIPCPSHDNPILLIPKPYRREFFDNLFLNNEFKYKLFTDKEYEWVFSDKACTICTSLYKALQSKLKNPSEVFNMIYAGDYHFNRRLGEGISVFNPGDKPLRESIITNEMLQNRLDNLFKDSNRVRYMFSNYARTNNGIYALMDIKNNNKDRLIELHNIISEGVHKVEHIEENVHSLFLALMNPEDKRNVSNIQSFMDRIDYIKIPYILDVRTEVEIYRDVFGKHIDPNFLPKVLHNFARVIISSRLNKRSDAMMEWIKKPERYQIYCDVNLHLLKIEIYTGNIPKWLEDDDMKSFTAQMRKKIIAESEQEGNKGFSGRDSIKIFNEFYSTYANDDKLINMSMLMNFFNKKQKDHPGFIPDGFLESLCKLYDFNALQEVKESLYNYNEDVIAMDIQDYLYAINFETNSEVQSIYTGRRFTVDDSFCKRTEVQVLGEKVDKRTRETFRRVTQKEYAGRTLTQEIMADGRNIKGTDLFLTLKEKILYNLKQKVLDPFLDNENFRRAIKDYGTENFRTYDTKIQEEVTFLTRNLVKKYQYTPKGAKEICMYVIDNELASKFHKV